MDTQTPEVAWLAGLFEGEGNISIAKNGGTRLTIRMTDRDVINRVDAMFPSTGIQIVIPKPVRAGYSQPKTQYAWRISNPDTVREILTLLLPWFGGRRAAQAMKTLEHLDTRVGIGGHNRIKTHCRNKHEYTPENTYIRPGTTHRACRKCKAESARRTRRDARGVRSFLPDSASLLLNADPTVTSSTST